MSLILYYYPLSQPSRAVLALLNMHKIKFEGKIIDLQKGEHKTAEYKAINPLGTVPCLVHGKLALGESNAILTYLCDAYPTELQSYKGLTIDERAKVSQYLSWYQGTYRPSLAKLLGMKLLALVQQTPVKASDIVECEKKICLTLDFLDAHLAKEFPYICGKRLTIADMLIFHETTNVEIYQIDLSPWKNVKAWYERMLEVKAIREIHNGFRGSLPDLLVTLSNVKIINELTLYTHILSQPCRAVMALLAIGKIEHKVVEVKLLQGETKTPEFLNTNRFGTIPAIVHGTEHIGDSSAILAYLCEAFPKELKAYNGTTLAEKAHINEYLSWYQSNYRPGLIATLIIAMTYARSERLPIKRAVIDGAREKMEVCLTKLDGFLSKGNPFMCGPRLTIADILFFHETINVIFYNVDLAAWPNVNSWFNRMM